MYYSHDSAILSFYHTILFVLRPNPATNCTVSGKKKTINNQWNIKNTIMYVCMYILCSWEVLLYEGS